MTFKKDKTADFIAIYKKYQKHIRAAQGCQHVELLQDIDNPHIFFTYSHWINQQALDQYKDSAIFGEVWPQTKALFDGKPMAWSTENLLL